VVGEVTRAGGAVSDLAPGDRVVLEPALGCAVRAIDPPCRVCANGESAACENATRGAISAGIQTGFCRDTGGAWSDEFVAHRSQIHAAPAGAPDEALVLAEPLACALHAVLAVPPPAPGEPAIVLGCGTIGLLAIAALRAIANGSGARVVAIARHAHQAARARALGADVVLTERGEALRERVAAETGAEVRRPEIGPPIFIGGAPVVYDCVGSPASLDDAVRFTRARGRVAVVGMPGIPRGIDWTAIWYKEITVRGCYAYGVESLDGRRERTFSIALRIASEQAASLAPLVGARFPLESYRDAIATALDTRRSGVVKTVFEPGGAR
jgi:threonine dehydrogenase-like Zn-dependent dehydrogenase